MEVELLLLRNENQQLRKENRALRASGAPVAHQKVVLR